MIGKGLNGLYELVKEKNVALDLYLFGHLFDGNIHINIMSSVYDYSEFEKVCEEFTFPLYKLIDDLGGLMSAEHGIGQLHQEHLKQIEPKEKLQFRKLIKQVMIQQISFQTPFHPFCKLKTAVIVCNGENPLQEDLKFYWEKSDLKVAADGGAIILKEYGFVPDRIIGDLDSWDHHSFLDIPVIRVEEQNTNDADKAIRYCIEQGIEEIALLGAHGKRSDQFMANLEVLYKYSSWIKIKLITNVDVIEVVRNQWKKIYLLEQLSLCYPYLGL